MKTIGLLPMVSREGLDLEPLREGIGRELHAECQVLPGNVDPSFAYHPERQQYHSTEILAHLGKIRTADSWRLLGVTDADLYIPILTFVFGEAQIGGPCALVSTCRLHQEFYGLPADPGLLAERLLKEAIHELGHTFSLPHCGDYSCAMAPSHGVERIDLKGVAFCQDCRTVSEIATAGDRVRRTGT